MPASPINRPSRRTVVASMGLAGTGAALGASVPGHIDQALAQVAPGPTASTGPSIPPPLSYLTYDATSFRPDFAPGGYLATDTGAYPPDGDGLLMVDLGLPPGATLQEIILVAFHRPVTNP